MFSIKVVRNIVREVKKTPSLHYINEGGCGVFAAILAQNLQKCGVQYKIAVFTYDKNVNIDEVRQGVEDPGNAWDWNSGNLHFVHIMVEFTHHGREYRADGRTLESASDVWSRYHRAAGDLTLKEIKKLAECEHNWNSAFDRDNIPTVKRIVNKQFAAIG